VSKAPSESAGRRFYSAVRRFRAGVELQRARILDARDSAPRLPAGDLVVRDLRGLNPNDLDYYIYELGRLQDAAREVSEIFDKPGEITDALAAFDAAVPNLRAARNPLTHASDDDRLDDVAWFESLVRMLPGGRVEYLVDPRDEQHDAALALADAVLTFLRNLPEVAAALGEVGDT
jgi:hypothetical protein